METHRMQASGGAGLGDPGRQWGRHRDARRLALWPRTGCGRPERLSDGKQAPQGGVAEEPRWYLHDGTHSPAVALPHAAETGLSPDVPELSKRG